LWELCPFELKNFPIYTTEAACQGNSYETTEQNFEISSGIPFANMTTFTCVISSMHNQRETNPTLQKTKGLPGYS
jgi:hypothetical protein